MQRTPRVGGELVTRTFLGVDPAEVRCRVRELTAHLDPMLPAGAQSRGGWPSQARDAAREAYLIARWCALEVGP